MRLGIVVVVVMMSGCGFDGPASNSGTDAMGDAPTELTLGFAAASSLTDEAVGSHKVPVVLSGSPTGTVTVHYKVLDGGTATRNQDFVLADGLLTFQTDVNEQDIAIEILQDNLDEPDETFTLALDSPVGAQLGLAMHHVTISANTVPRVAFATASMNLSETVTAPGISVALDKMTSVPVMVQYKVVAAAGPNLATGGGVDYTLADGVLTISAGTLGGIIPLAIVNDALDEEDEQLAIQLSNPVNAELGAAALFTYTILDEDPPPTVAFASATTSLAEAAGTTSIPVSLSAPSGKPITVPYTVTLGTASAADVAVADGTLTFPPGTTTRPIPLAVIQDLLDEDDETFTLTLGTPTNATVGTIGSDLVTIVDDDAAPTVSITTASGAVAEGVGTVTLTVALSAASGKPITVAFAGTGTATATADYSYAPASALAFTPGTLSQTIAIAVVQDTLDEPDETVITTLVGATNATASGSPHTLTILDDDPTCFGPPGNYQICIQTVPTTPVTLVTGTLNTDTAAGGGSPLCATTTPMGWTMNQPDACFVMGTTISIASGATVKVTGPRPLVLLATDTLTIAGTLDVSSHLGASSGPASNLGCASYTVAPQASATGGGGGAGGSFMSAGGNGGDGDGGSVSTGGMSLGAAQFPPTALRGGCDGQRGGGGGANLAGSVGHGGGAVYLLAGNAIDVSGGVIDASGSGGTGGDNFTGGSGAGAGGMIELSATTYTMNAATRLFANGGGGAGGADTNSSGGSGADPTAAAITTFAPGGTGGGGGNGGKGFAGITQATAGAPGGNNKGGGGGGGGGGFIQSTVALTTTTLSAGVVDSP